MKLSATTLRLGLLLLLCFCALVAIPGTAAIKNFGFQGTVTTVSDLNFLLDGSITNGTPFEGYYVFDTSAASENPDSTVGDYRYTTSAFGVTVKAGNYVFRSNPDHVNFLIELVNRTNDDHYLFRSYNNVCSQPLLVDHISWQLDDTTGTALTSASLPPTPPVLASYTQIFGLMISGGGCPYGFSIRGVVDSISENPSVIPQSPSVFIREAVEIRWPSVLGYFYQIQASNDLTNWTNLGRPIMGDGTMQSTTVPKGTNSCFRAEIINYAR